MCNNQVSRSSTVEITNIKASSDLIAVAPPLSPSHHDHRAVLSDIPSPEIPQGKWSRFLYLLFPYGTSCEVAA